jgi:hypothetical protein
MLELKDRLNVYFERFYSASEARQAILADKQVQLELAQPREDGRALLDAVNQAAARLGYTSLADELPKKFSPEPARPLLPAVNPADLKRLWAIQQDLQELAKKYPPGPPGTSTCVEEPRLGEIANLEAVSFRLTTLLGLRGHGGLLGLPPLPGLDEKPSDTVFKAFATVPMIDFRSGDSSPHQGWPFDAEELVRLLQKELDK